MQSQIKCISSAISFAGVLLVFLGMYYTPSALTNQLFYWRLHFCPRTSNYTEISGTISRTCRLYFQSIIYKIELRSLNMSLKQIINVQLQGRKLTFGYSECPNFIKHSTNCCFWPVVEAYLPATFHILSTFGGQLVSLLCPECENVICVAVLCVCLCHYDWCEVD